MIKSLCALALILPTLAYAEEAKVGDICTFKSSLAVAAKPGGKGKTLKIPARGKATVLEIGDGGVLVQAKKVKGYVTPAVLNAACKVVGQDKAVAAKAVPAPAPANATAANAPAPIPAAPPVPGTEPAASQPPAGAVPPGQPSSEPAPATPAAQNDSSPAPSAAPASIPPVVDAPHASGSKPKIVVMDVLVQDVDAKIAAPLTEVLSTEIGRLQKFEVITSRDIATMVGFTAEKQKMGCDDVSCIAEIGGSLGAELIVGSSVGKVGDTFVVNIKLIDTRKVKVEQRVYEKVQGRAEDLLDAFKKAVPRLFNTAALPDENQASVFASPKTWTYITLGTGAAAAVFGGVSMFLAINAVKNKPQWTIEQANSSRMWAGMMYGGFGAGAALLLTSASLWLFTGHPAATIETPVALGIAPAANGFALSLQGAW